MNIKKAIAVILCSTLIGTSLCGCASSAGEGTANLGMLGSFRDSVNNDKVEEEVLKEVVSN